MPLATAFELASALGVTFEPPPYFSSTTMASLQSDYAGARLYADAARIGEQWLNSETDISPRERARQLQQTAGYYRLAGKAADASRLAAESEKLWKAAIASTPWNSAARMALVELYASDAFGRDSAKALAALQDSRKEISWIEPIGAQEAYYLFEVGRYDDAYQAYTLAKQRGRVLGVRDLYRDGIAAAKCGKALQATETLRVALWRAPQHPLAKAAREVTGE